MRKDGPASPERADTLTGTRTPRGSSFAGRGRRVASISSAEKASDALASGYAARGRIRFRERRFGQVPPVQQRSRRCRLR